MRKENKLEFEKMISRDWSVLSCQMWLVSYTTEFKRQFGWRYTDAIFEGKNNVVSVYHPSIERYVSSRDFVIAKISSDKQWLIKIISKLKPKVSDLIKWCKKFDRSDLENKSGVDLAELADEIFQKMNEVSPSFLIDLSFPFQMENHPEAVRYQESIAAAIAARAAIEGLASIVNEFTLLISKEAIKRSGIKDDSLKKYLTFDEIKKIFLEKKINKKKIEKRKEYFLLSSDGFSQENVERFITRKGWLLKEYQTEVSEEIKGSVACKGLARGIARIVLSGADFGKVKKGDVIVSSMSTPDYLPVLKKAVAIVTDEGGITCHAAIVSREMKKPCIIGTKIATKVLHDGDLLEVDADKGIVKIIK
jgi:phosphoenolpyruvate synthase/pyruvate phosphate dikinase